MHLIRKFAETTQFILVTHNKRTMEAADRMYGITMAEQGVSKLVGVKFEKEEETETTHRIESAYGKFSRSFTLPSDADEAKISAKSKNGVLKVRIPKMQETKESRVRVSVE